MILSRNILERFIKGMREMKGYTCIKYFKWKRSCHHFPIVFTLKLETSNEEENIGNTNGVGPSSTRTEEEEPTYLIGGKHSPKNEAGGMTYAS
jgi:hypothetical protein